MEGCTTTGAWTLCRSVKSGISPSGRFPQRLFRFTTLTTRNSLLRCNPAAPLTAGALGNGATARLRLRSARACERTTAFRCRRSSRRLRHVLLDATTAILYKSKPLGPLQPAASGLEHKSARNSTGASPRTSRADPVFFTWTRRSGRPRAMRSAPRAHLHHHVALTPRPDHAATWPKAFCRGQPSCVAQQALDRD